MDLVHKPKPLLLCILDGFGFREPAADNAITMATAPVWRDVWSKSPHSLLVASGEDVGLPTGQMGNSEVGHMNIGAGRVVYQDLPLIDRAIASGDLSRNAELRGLIDSLRKSGGRCHVMGLVSEGGVHSHRKHILYLIKIIASQGIPVCLHAFLDGRDVPPQSAAQEIDNLCKELASISGVSLSTLCGRYYAMDRDKRWDRVEKAYDLIVDAKGTVSRDPVKAINASYAEGVYDEFILPVTIGDYDGVKAGDGILCANFRADRVRELLAALLDPDFIEFERRRVEQFSAAVGMTEYSTQHNKWLGTLFPQKVIENSLGEVLSKNGLTQLRIAETEKYPHVTFFFNGGREEPYDGEDRRMVPSPKVATYDLQPEMSAFEVTQHVVECIKGQKHDVIILNYANPDMVGHTGSLHAAVKAIETIDKCLHSLLLVMDQYGATTVITADHGNCEQMSNPQTNGPHTAHTLSKVPFVIVGNPSVKALNNGRLADIAPTILDLIGLQKPSEMDGVSLVVR